MHSSKFLTILKTLSTSERRRFKEFVESPFFNKHGKLIALLDYLYESAPKFEGSKLDRTKAYKALFPKEAYNESNFKNLLSDLKGLLEKFLAYNQLEVEGAFTEQYFLLRRYSESKLDRLFDLKRDKMRKNLEKAEPYEMKFLDQFLLLKLSEDTAVHRDESSATTFRNTTNSLEVFYIYQRLKYACELLNRAQIRADDYAVSELSSFRDYLGEVKEKINQHPLVDLYYLLFTVLESPDNEALYAQFKSDLMQIDHTQIPLSELHQLYMTALNYCATKLNQGLSQYAQEMFDVYKAFVDKQLITINDKALAPVFKNIVTIGIRVKQFEWVESFIEEHIQHFDETNRDDVYNYNLAYINSEKGDYSKAMRILLSVEFPDVYYQLGAKTILLKCYYEKQDLETLLSYADATILFLRRNKLISELNKEGSTNFIRCLKRIADLRINMEVLSRAESARQIEILQSTISNSEMISNKAWLRDKINELKTQTTSVL